jgi:hypothetical protein
MGLSEQAVQQTCVSWFGIAPIATTQARLVSHTDMLLWLPLQPKYEETYKPKY